MSEPEGNHQGLFDAISARGPVGAAVSDHGWLEALLAFEGALARAEARAGLVPVEDAEAIARVCGRPDTFDIGALGRGAAASGNPVPALVRALSAAVGGRAGGHVHAGATSQDAMDTAAMLVARRALDLIVADLEGACDAAATLATRHRDTPMAGRTLLQQALPTTFGLAAAGWLAGLDDAVARLTDVRRHRLAVQLGGAAGTLAYFGDRGLAVAGHLAEELGLAAPALPWHTARGRVVELAAALGQAAAAAGKAARDITLLAQTEVGEVREGRPGGSSTLAQKQNPIAAVSVVACAVRAPGLVATLLVAAAAQEHQRAAGAWHAEWAPLCELLLTVGSAAAWLRDGLAHLEVDAARMRANLDASGGLILAERVTAALAPALGRPRAHDLVAAVAAAAVTRAQPFRDALAADPEVAPHLDPAGIATLLDPAGYLGSAGAFVDRALAAHARRRGMP
jgi:3-carboxy-cis,cis-muconate cycloisomerase